MKEHLAFGLKDGALISISKVPSGISCGCICPSCKAILLARKGNKNKHHFAHYHAHDCGGGQETALHMIAKEVIAKERKVFIPPEVSGKAGGIIGVDGVVIEPRTYEGFVPDIVVREHNREINIEIRVHHAVDERKQERLIMANLATIEIDLSSLVDDFTEKDVMDVIMSGEHTKWIYSPTIEREKRIQRVKDELCDFLPSESLTSPRWGVKVSCPCQGKAIWSSSGSKCCFHACNCLDDQRLNFTKDDQIETIPCKYREKNIDIGNVSDIKDVVRENGRIVSACILCSNTWENWAGEYNGLLIKDYTPRESSNPHHQEAMPGSDLSANRTLQDGVSVEGGKTVFELWKSEYQYMIVQNMANGNLMMIPGKDGEMFRASRSPYSKIVGHYSNVSRYAGYMRTKLYVVWNAEDPVWKLIRAKERVQMPHELSATHPQTDTVTLPSDKHSSPPVKGGNNYIPSTNDKKVPSANIKVESNATSKVEAQLRKNQIPHVYDYKLIKCKKCNFTNPNPDLYEVVYDCEKAYGGLVVRDGLCKKCAKVASK